MNAQKVKSEFSMSKVVAGDELDYSEKDFIMASDFRSGIYEL
jgi:hypothetical protein